MALKRFRAVIHGRVQGVGFRFFTQREARRLNVKGFSKNLPDGTVEVVGEAEPKQAEEFVSLLYRGPLSSDVEKVDLVWEKPKKDFSFFSIR